MVDQAVYGAGHQLIDVMVLHDIFGREAPERFVRLKGRSYEPFALRLRHQAMPLFRFWCAVDASQNTVWTADLMIRGGSCFMRVTRSCSGAVVAEPSGRRFRSLAALPILCQGLLC